jgi:osmotically-inducible protein OsmY
VKNFPYRFEGARAASAFVSVSAVALLCVGLSGGLSGCALPLVPLLVGGGMVGGGLMVTDRRTTGTQIEDESIEIKAAARARELATLGRISITSYNRLVLITGEVPGEAEKLAVGQAVARVENVRSVVNELAVADNIRVGARSSDAVLSAKVKATFVDAKDVQANAYKVVSERGIVYLMGRVTEREAARGAELASSIPGVQKVVRVFDILSEAELGSLGRPGVAVNPPVAQPSAAASGADK